jgi:hypothetical protein
VTKESNLFQFPNNAFYCHFDERKRGEIFPHSEQDFYPTGTMSLLLEMTELRIAQNFIGEINKRRKNDHCKLRKNPPREFNGL